MTWHDQFAHVVSRCLLRRGYRVATEAGVRGGRVDLVRLDSAGNWVDLYEVKVNRYYYAQGIRQLRGYADVVEGEPRLTLIVPLGTATRELRREATAAGVKVWAFDYVRHCDNESSGSGVRVHLPALHSESIDRIRAAVLEWNKSPEAVLARQRSVELCRIRVERTAA